MPDEHPCGGCGTMIQSSPQWLCRDCILAWEAAIERQSSRHRHRHVADLAERHNIQTYRAARRDRR